MMAMFACRKCAVYLHIQNNGRCLRFKATLSRQDFENCVVSEYNVSFFRAQWKVIPVLGSSLPVLGMKKKQEQGRRWVIF